MRVVIKPAGLFMLIAVIAALSCLAFFGFPRPQKAVVAETPTTPAATANTSDLIAGHAWSLAGGEPNAAEMKERTDAVPGVGEPVKIYTLLITKATKDPWGVGFHVATPVSLTKGEKLRLTLRARSPEAVPFIVNFEQNEEPYFKSVAQDIATTSEWKPYTVEFTVQEDYAPEKSHTTLHCGVKAGTLELADLHLYRVDK